MKVKNIMFSGFMAVVLAGVCGAASAAADMTGDGALVVASKAYVDAKATNLSDKDTELSGKITALEDANKSTGTVGSAIAAAQSAADAAQGDVDALAGKMDLTNENSDLSKALATKEDTANKLDSTQIDLLNTDGTVNKDAVNALVGNDTKFPTVGAAVEIANAKAQQVLENVNSVSANLGTLTSKVDEHTASITKLEGNADTAGSVANAIKQSNAYTDDQITTLTNGAVKDNKDAIEAEVLRATGEETRIEGLVTAEKSRAEGKETELAQAIADEKSRAEAAEAQALADAKAYTDAAAAATEGKLTGGFVKTYVDEQIATVFSEGDLPEALTDIEQLKADVAGAETAIETITKEGGTIDTKVSALEDKLMNETNGTVTVAVATEKSRAEGKEAELAQAIADEKSRAEGVEAGLQTAINTINDTTNGIYAQAKEYTDKGLGTIYSNASECIANSQSNNCILSARTGNDGNPAYVWISLTAPAE